MQPLLDDCAVCDECVSGCIGRCVGDGREVWSCQLQESVRCGEVPCGVGVGWGGGVAGDVLCSLRQKGGHAESEAVVEFGGGQEPFHALGHDVGGEGAVEEGCECVCPVDEYHPVLGWCFWRVLDL